MYVIVKKIRRKRFALVHLSSIITVITEEFMSLSVLLKKNVTDEKSRIRILKSLVRIRNNVFFYQYDAVYMAWCHHQRHPKPPGQELVRSSAVTVLVSNTETGLHGKTAACTRHFQSMDGMGVELSTLNPEADGVKTQQNRLCFTFKTQSAFFYHLG